MANETEILEIRVHNSYGDTFERELEDPTCSEVIREFVTIAQQLGYPMGCIYAALLDEADGVKESIRISYDHIQEEDKSRK